MKTLLRSNSAINLLSVLRNCSPKAIEKFLSGISCVELDFLYHDWSLWARDDQLPSPENHWTTWLILGGRGAGKTRAGAEWVRRQACEIASSRIALVAETLYDARSIMVEGVSGLLSIHPQSERPIFEPSKRQLTWPNGSVAHLFSSEDPESLRGPQFTAAWCDELAKWKQPQLTWDMLQFALRLGKQPRQVVTTTPRPVPLLKEILESDLTYITKAATRRNAGNLAPGFLKAIVSRYENTNLGRQELEGELLFDRPDALWRREDIEASRIEEAPALERIVVAVDPPVTSGAKSDACGIVAVGVDECRQAYVLEDATMKRVRPLDWARAVINMYHKYEADRIVVEVNQGGELVETVIRQIDAEIPIRAVHASRGKWVRAEPAAALYEQSRVSHVGSFPELEDQMCDFSRNGLSGGASPDRLDALVWALTDLLLGYEPEPRLRTL